MHADAADVLILVSVTRLGDFCKFPTINCITKVAQIFCACLGYFETSLCY